MSSTSELPDNVVQGSHDESFYQVDQKTFNLTTSKVAPTAYTTQMSKNTHEDNDRHTRITYTRANEADAQRFVRKIDNRVSTENSPTLFLDVGIPPDIQYFERDVFHAYR